MQKSLCIFCRVIFISNHYFRKTNPMKLLYVFILFVNFAYGQITYNSPSQNPHNVSASARENNSVSQNLFNAPLAFEKNNGQFNPDIRFVARSTGGVTYYFSEHGITITLHKNTVQASQWAMGSSQKEMSSDVINLSFLNANTHPAITSEELLPSVTNYFFGNNKAKWKANVENYSRLRYHNIYEGIDIVYYGNGKKLEYDFIVHPNANPNLIRLQYEGVEGTIFIESNGNVAIPTDVGLLHEKKPFAYQENSLKKNEVNAHWQIVEENQLQFALANYDCNTTLYIDPILYSTFLGGSSSDYGYSIAADNNGNAYIAGITASFNFPISGGAFDASQNGGHDVFVTKLDSNGTLVYSTFVGGSLDENATYGAYVAIDNSGNAYVTGSTLSSDFPTTNGAFDSQLDEQGYGDAFVFKLNSSGSSLVFSTYLGGFYYEYGGGIAVNNSGKVAVTGMTYSSDFPTTDGASDTTANGSWDFYVTKFNTTGTALEFSTYIGGASDEYTTQNCLAMDASGNVYATGYTASTDFQTSNGAFDETQNGGYDAVAMKFSDTGSLIYSTYLGGAGQDYGYGIAATDDGDAVITGITASANFPVTAGAYDNEFNASYDCFATKISSNGNTIQFSTYLGGTGSDFGIDIALDNFENIYVTGYTVSSDFPVTSNAFDVTYNGGSTYGYDIFVTKMKYNGTAVYYSSYLGGTSDDYGIGIAVY